MNITEVRIRPVKSDGKTRAIASITFDDSFVVKELKVVEGPSGLFVSMPSRKVGAGGYRDIAHPITAEAREEIQTMVLEEFQKQTGTSGAVTH
ncbi:MAG: septation regulator SpoVG [Bacillota bacterium]|nr:septation regulator SpoVG [Bacillota bacterium]MDI9414667.1 septation regulator SpoVG [Bacillota bacterium]NLD12610.1 septation regulator SpoVG [Bacillota bacterium]HAV20348.1 transcriptional regulator [Bacillota bacterium]HCD41997.1 transcriptional regulator [Bacillota bacterium]